MQNQREITKRSQNVKDFIPLSWTKITSQKNKETEYFYLVGKQLCVFMYNVHPKLGLS